MPRCWRGLLSQQLRPTPLPSGGPSGKGVKSSITGLLKFTGKDSCSAGQHLHHSPRRYSESAASSLSHAWIPTQRNWGNKCLLLHITKLSGNLSHSHRYLGPLPYKSCNEHSQAELYSASVVSISKCTFFLVPQLKCSIAYLKPICAQSAQ